MISNKNEAVRRECIKNLPLNLDTLQYFTIRTLDTSHIVRCEIYQKLESEWHDFKEKDSVSPEIMLSLIINGLSDVTKSVAEAAVKFLRTMFFK